MNEKNGNKVIGFKVGEFRHDDKLYRVIDGLLYKHTGSCWTYTDITNDGDLRTIATTKGWTGNISEKVDPFHSKQARQKPGFLYGSKGRLIDITVNYQINPWDVNDIIACALEGGINYWCAKATIHESPKDAEDKIEYASDVVGYGGILALHEPEGAVSDQFIHLLTLDKFINGLKQHAENSGNSIEYLIENHDAGDADCIMQYAIFNKLIYG